MFSLKRLHSFILGMALFLSIVPSAFAIPFSATGYDPVNAKSDIVDVTLSPGQTGSFWVQFTNRDSVTHIFQAIPIDRIPLNGDYVFANMVDEQFEVGLWGAASETIELGPDEVGTVEVVFTVPDDLALGDYVGGIKGVVLSGLEEGEEASVGGVGTAVLTEVGFILNAHVVEATEYETVAAYQEEAEEIVEPGLAVPAWAWVLLGLLFGSAAFAYKKQMGGKAKGAKKAKSKR